VISALIKSLLASRRNARDAGQPGLREAMELLDGGRLDGARTIAAALSRSPNRVHEALYLDFEIASRGGNQSQALEKIQAAVQARPDEPVYRLRAAELLFSLGNFERSREEFERLLVLDDDAILSDPQILYAAAQACKRSGHVERAVELLRRVLAIQPGFEEARSSLAGMLDWLGDPDSAREALAPLISAGCTAGLRLRRALMLPVVNQSVEAIAQARAALSDELDALLAEPRLEFTDPEREVGLTGFLLAYQGCDDLDLLRKLARVVRKGYGAAHGGEGARRVRSAGGKIRVGFVSTYFFFHSIARTTYGLIRDLPRERFEVHVFSIGAREDEWSEAVRRVSNYHGMLPNDVLRVREVIESAELDVLFFADIGMNPTTYYLAFWRMAPIQMTTWGHPSTTGIDTMDYFVSSAQLEPEAAQQHYSEKLVRLPGYFMPAYERPGAPAASRAQLGLAADARLYYCPQMLFKLHPDFDAALKGILERDARAQIRLLANQNQRRPQEALSRRLAASLGELASRVAFNPALNHQQFIQHLQAADVILDPFHFGGNNSSMEAMAVATPVVTLPGAHVRGRFTLGQYRELEMGDLIAGGAEEYVQLALRVANEPGLRSAMAATLRERAGVLFDRQDAGRALGEALERIVEAGAPG
jgi:predicted O-linked N-acetylglucosamine transferase (SPINDLY family)